MTADLETLLAAIRSSDGTVLIPVRAHPRARREGPTGVHAGALRIATTTPADRGRATAAVGAILAGLLDLPASSVLCVKGGTGRDKVYAVAGLALSEARRRLREALT